jgi:hypothetical protein
MIKAKKLRRGYSMPHFVEHILITETQKVIDQGLSVLSCFSDDDYINTYVGDRECSSVGSHFRHIWDHYTCFFEGRLSGAVSYELRERNELFAQDVSFAKYSFLSLKKRLSDLTQDDLNRGLSVDVVHEDARCFVESSVLRELQFLLSHMLHHFAVIKIFAEDKGLECPKHFGVAPSTIRHLEETLG